MSARYGDYAKDVSGWFLGMTGAQLALVTLAGVPALLALNAQAWGLLLVWLPVWALLAAVLLVPVRGRSAGRWLVDLFLHAIGALMGWTVFGSRAASGTAEDLAEAACPGCWPASAPTTGRPTGRCSPGR